MMFASPERKWKIHIITDIILEIQHLKLSIAHCTIHFIVKYKFGYTMKNVVIGFLSTQKDMGKKRRLETDTEPCLP